MKKLTLGRALKLILPTGLVGALIIIIAATFGEGAGEAMGILEGSLIVFLGIYLYFHGLIDETVYVKIRAKIKQKREARKQQQQQQPAVEQPTQKGSDATV